MLLYFCMTPGQHFIMRSQVLSTLLTTGGFLLREDEFIDTRLRMDVQAPLLDGGLMSFLLFPVAEIQKYLAHS